MNMKICSMSDVKILDLGLMQEHHRSSAHPLPLDVLIPILLGKGRLVPPLRPLCISITITIQTHCTVYIHFKLQLNVSQSLEVFIILIIKTTWLPAPNHSQVLACYFILTEKGHICNNSCNHCHFTLMSFTLSPNLESFALACPAQSL